MKSLITVILLIVFSLATVGQQKEIPFTLADRDRLIQVEEQLKSLNQRFEDMNQRFGDMNRRFDDMNARMDRMEDKFDIYFTWGFGLVLGAILILMGFILWDRRTTIAPVQQQQQKMLDALKELSKENLQIREALKKVSLY